jgi:hypothetical protein
VWVLGVLGSLGGIAVLVFRPWQREPFDLLDFSEFLVQLQSSREFLDGWGALAAYYASQGRVNEIVYGIIAVNYSLFGLDPLGWRIVWSVQVLLLLPASYLVLRRFGAGRLGSIIGASLYGIGTVPAAAWLRQTSEPLGALFMLAAATMAHGWGDAPRGVRRTIAVAACVTGMLLCKETLVAALPFLCVVAACWSAETEVHPPRLDRCTAYFAVACLAACLVLGAALLWASSRRELDAYAALYGSSALTNRVVAGRLAQMTLPVSFHTEPWRLLVFPPNFVFVACFLAGLALLVWASDTCRRTTPKLLIAAVLPAAGILIYLPWPRFEPFYAIPFMFGVVLATAVLVDASAAGLRPRLVVIVCWLFVLAGSALNAFGLAQFTRAQRLLNYQVAQQIAKYSPSDTVVVVSADLTSQPWQNPAATLGRYVRAVDLTQTPPALVDRECRVGGQLDLARIPEQHVQLVYEAACGKAPQANRAIERRFRYFDWFTLTFQQVALRVAVIEPSR